MGLVPMRFVSFHSVGFVHPHAKHVIFSIISLPKVEVFKFLIGVLEVHIKFCLVWVLMISGVECDCFEWIRVDLVWVI